MPIFNLAFYAFSEIRETFLTPLSTTETTGANTEGRILIENDAQLTVIEVDDDDDFFEDDTNETGASQVTTQALTINGTTFPAGSVVELEFAARTGNFGEGPPLYFVRIGGENVGLAAPKGALPAPGDRFRFRTGNADDPFQTSWNEVACFTDDTMLETPDGPRRIGTLRPGDLVLTRDNCAQPIRWIGSCHLSAVELILHPKLQPIRIAAGALGNVDPVTVSPQHRVLIEDWRAEVLFGEAAVLTPAKALVGASGIETVLPAEGVTYVHIMFDRHELVCSAGLWSESLLAGEGAFAAVSPEARAELMGLFPDLAGPKGAQSPVRPMVRPHEGRALVV